MTLISKMKLLEVIHQSKCYFSKSQKCFGRRLKGFLFRRAEDFFDVAKYLEYLNNHAKSSYRKELAFYKQILELANYTPINTFMLNYYKRKPTKHSKRERKKRIMTQNDFILLCNCYAEKQQMKEVLFLNLLFISGRRSVDIRF